MPHQPSPSLLQLKRPVVWVTGASRGIGREIARQFASLGCIVALSARSKRQLFSLQKEILSLGLRAKVFPCDISNFQSVSSTAKAIVRSFSGIDVLINNAGTTMFKSFRATSVTEFESIFSTNLRGAMYATKAVYPLMVKKGQGWIINILSTSAIQTFTGSSAYSATKSGLQGLARILREEAREYNVRVTNVYPGSTDTEMWSKADREKYRSRMMKAKSVAEAVLAVYQMPSDVVVEEIVLRPIQGDI